MFMRHHASGATPCRAFLLLLAIGCPAIASAQQQTTEKAAASAAVEDRPLTAAERQAFIGTYAVTLPHGQKTSFRVFEEDGVLKGEPEGMGAARLLHQGSNVFFVEGVPNFSFAFVVENGRATRFTLRKEDGMGEGVRVP